MTIETAEATQETILEEIPQERKITLAHLKQAETFREYLETLGAFDESVGSGQIDIELADGEIDILYKDDIKKFAHDLWHAINESETAGTLVQKIGTIVPISFTNVIDFNNFSKYAQDVFEAEGENLSRQIAAATSILDLEKVFSLKKGIKTSADQIMPGRAVLSVIEGLKHVSGEQFDSKLQELPETCDLRAKARTLFELNAVHFDKAVAA